MMMVWDVEGHRDKRVTAGIDKVGVTKRRSSLHRSLFRNQGGVEI